MRPIRVCIDARLRSGESGGIEQVVIGLAGGLAAIENGGEEYLFLTWKDHADWIRPHVGSGHIVTVPPPSIPQRIYAQLSGRHVRRRLLSKAPYMEGLTGRVPKSDGFIEHLGVDVMHFTYQSAFLTAVPSIYHPHDLQHVHLPQFFPARERRQREAWYGAFCRQARLVAVTSEWIRKDVIAHFQLPAEKVQVVPLAPPTANYPDPSPAELDRVKRELNLPDAFIFYPAQTWPHKNHLRLLDALATLRDRDGLRVNLVCSGRRNEFFQEIDRQIRAQGLVDQTRFVDFVDPLALQCIYRLARAVVIPTLFEAGSFPLLEAFRAGVAAACSNVTSLPELAGEAALVFDPLDVGAISDAVKRLWTDESLRRDLIVRGHDRVAQFTWERTARQFRSHYRRIAGRPDS